MVFCGWRNKHVAAVVVWVVIFLAAESVGQVCTAPAAEGNVIVDSGSGKLRAVWGAGTGDMNGDGRLDLVVANSQSTPRVRVYLNNGTVSAAVLGAGTGLGTSTVASFQGSVEADSEGGNGLVVADVDADGVMDIAVASRLSAVVLFGAGDGVSYTKVTAMSATVAWGVANVAVADIDGDSWLDIAMASREAPLQVTVARHTAARVFDTPVVVSAGFGGEQHTSDVEWADFDGDGFMDMAVSATGSPPPSTGVLSGAYVVMGTGVGAWAPAVQLFSFSTTTIYGAMSDTLVADINNDTWPDALFTVQDNRILLFVNDGAGGFEPMVTVPGGTRTHSLVALDADGDGDLDLFVGTAASTAPTYIVFNLMLPGEPSSLTFGQPLLASSPVRRGNQAVAGDFDGDGWPDILAPSSDEFEVRVIYNSNVMGKITPTSISSERVTSMLLDDYDADGDLDLVVGHEGSLSVFPNSNGNGAFSALANLAGLPGPDNANIIDFCSLDFNQDGALDFAVLYGPRSLSSPASLALVVSSIDATNTGAANQVVPNYGPILNVTALLSPGTFAYDGYIDCEDINDDGYVDILASSYREARPYWILNTDGSVGGLTGYAAGPLAGPQSGAWFRGSDTVAVADVTGDGVKDLVYGSGFVGALGYYPGTGLSGAAAFGSLVAVLDAEVRQESLGGVGVADFDADGDVDLFVADSCCQAGTQTRIISLFVNNGAGEFTASVNYTGLVTFASSVTVTDMTGNGLPDVLVGTTWVSDTLWVFINPTSSPGVFNEPFNIGASANEVTAVLSSSIALGDLNGDGSLDIVSGPKIQTVGSTLWWFARSSVFKQYPVQSSSVTVDTRACGATVQCVAKAMVAAPKCATVRTTVLVPPGTYTGCFQIGPFTVDKRIAVKPSTPGGRVVFDCTSGGGVLFHVVSGGDLVLESIDVRGTSLAAKSAFGTTALRVSDGGVLALEDVTFKDTFPDSSPGAYGAVGLFQYGYGGAIMVESRGSVSVSRCNFTSTRALVSGGAIALIGQDLTAVVSDSVFEGCSAGSAGGVLFVDALDSSVSVTGSRLGGSAAHVGGALYVGSPSVTVTMSSSTLAANSAVFGGAVATMLGSGAPFSSTADALGDVPLSNPAAAVSASTTVSLTAVELSGNSATYGGTFAVCQSPLVLGSGTSVDGSSASRCGGVAVMCALGSGSAWTPPLGSGSGALTDVPWVSGPAAAGVGPGTAGVFGPTVCSPPQRVSWSPALSGSLPAGNLLGTADLVVVDAFGQSVIDEVTSVTLAIASTQYAGGADAIVLRDGDRSLFLAESPVSFGGVSLVPTFGVSQVADLGRSAVVSVAVDGVLSSAVRTEVVVNVTACPPSQGSVSGDKEGFFRCQACGESQGSETVSVSPCTGCPPSQFNDPSTGGCTSCPQLTEQTVNVDNATDVTPLELCQCVGGAYSPSGLPGVACVTCPTGGVCPGRLERPYAAPGFYDVSDAGDGSKFSRCPREEACVGGLTVCQTGYQGYMCRSCSPGYYSSSSKRCVPCPKTSTATLVIFFVLVVAIAMFVVGVAAFAHVQFDTDEDVRKSQRMRKIPHSVTLAVVFFQIVGMVSNQQLKWPSSVRETMGAANVVNLDVNLFASECSLVSFDGKYLLSILYPVLFMAAVVVALVLFKLLRGVVPAVADVFSDLPMTQMLERVVFLMGSILYIPLSRSSLLLFDCVQLPDGKYYLDADLGRRCYDSGWYTLLPWGIAAVLLYVIAVPLYFGFTLFWHKDELFVPSVLMRYGSIYRLYRIKYFYFELVQLGKRLVVVFCALFVSNYQTWLVALLLGLFLSSALVHLSMEPHYHPIYNRLEFQLNIIISVIVMLGYTFYADLFETSWSRTTFIVVAIAVIVAALLLIVVTTIREVYAILHQVVGPASFTSDARVKRFWKIVEAEAPDWSDPSLKAQLLEMRRTYIADEQAEKAEFERRKSSSGGPAPWNSDAIDDGIMLNDVDTQFVNV